MNAERQKYILDLAIRSIRSLPQSTKHMNGIPELIDFVALELPEGRKPNDLTSSSPSKSHVFNYAPESIVRNGNHETKTYDAVWVSGEIATIQITLRNPLLVDLEIGSVSLELENNEAFHVDILPCNACSSLKSGETRTIGLNIRVRSLSDHGVLTVKGIHICWGNDIVPYDIVPSSVRS